MSHTNYSVLLSRAYPGASWTLYDNYDYNSLVWSDTNSIPKPSLEQLTAAVDANQSTEAMRLLRLKRDELLQQTDKYMISDFPHPDEPTKQAWMDYRQALRDLTASATPQLTPTLQLDESSVAWPAKPSG